MLMQSVGNEREAASADQEEAEKAIYVVRKLIDRYGQLPVAAETLAPDADLYQAGLTSFAAIRIMLALEDACGLEFPKRMLHRQSVASIDSIVACLQELQRLSSEAA